MKIFETTPKKTETPIWNELFHINIYDPELETVNLVIQGSPSFASSLISAVSRSVLFILASSRPFLVQIILTHVSAAGLIKTIVPGEIVIQMKKSSRYFDSPDYAFKWFSFQSPNGKTGELRLFIEYVPTGTNPWCWGVSKP